MTHHATRSKMNNSWLEEKYIIPYQLNSTGCQQQNKHYYICQMHRPIKHVPPILCNLRCKQVTTPIFLVISSGQSPSLFGDGADGRHTYIYKNNSWAFCTSKDILQLPELGTALFPTSLVEEDGFIFVEFVFRILRANEGRRKGMIKVSGLRRGLDNNR